VRDLRWRIERVEGESVCREIEEGVNSRDRIDREGEG